MILLAGLAAACGGEPDRRPNVILIVVDTLRADAVFDERGIFDTPAIDAFAADGVVFPQTFSHAPMTLPAHTSLFSSRPPLETGVLNNGQHVPDDLPLLAEWLREYGYATRAVTSLGTLQPLAALGPGLGRGFDDYDDDFWMIDPAEEVLPRMQASLAAWDGAQPLFFFGHFCDPHQPYDSHRDTGRVIDVELDGEPFATVSSENMDVLREPLDLAPGPHTIELRSEHPFELLYFGLRDGDQDVELRWEVGAPDESTTHARVAFERDANATQPSRLELWASEDHPLGEVPVRYMREVAHVDRYVGLLIDELKARGLYDDSLVIFTSDHGEGLGERGFGHIDRLTREALRVPLIVKPPRGSEHRAALEASADKLVRHVDLVPTILELAGVPPLPGQTGVSIATIGDVVHLAQTHRPEANDDKVSLQDERYKMIYSRSDDAVRMFDLASDPNERTDVFATRASERPEWPARLRAIATAAIEGRTERTLDDEARRQLEALGY